MKLSSIFEKATKLRNDNQLSYCSIWHYDKYVRVVYANKSIEDETFYKDIEIDMDLVQLFPGRKVNYYDKREKQQNTIKKEVIK